MTHELRHSAVTVGRLDDDEYGSHDIRDGLLEVDDAETARALVARHRVLSWQSEPPEADEDESDESDAEDAGRKTDEDDAPLVKTDPDQLTEAQRLIDSADYRALQQAAGQLDGVAGNQSETELRVALHTDVNDGDVTEAFDAVDAADGSE